MHPKFIFTDEQIKEVEALAETLSCKHIAHTFGISETTYYAACGRQPEVSLAYKRGKAKKIKRYVEKLDIKVFDESDTACLMFALKTQAGWREKKTIKFNPEEIKNLKDTKQITSYLIDGLLKSNELTSNECLDLVKTINNVQLVENIEGQINIFDKLTQEQALQLKGWIYDK